MSGPIKGFPSKKRDLSLKAEEVYATGSPVGNDKHGLDVSASIFATETASAQTIDTFTSAKKFDSVGTTAKEGDILRFSNGSKAVVQSVSGDTITLGNLPDPALAGTETFDILTPNVPVVDANGNITTTSTPIKFRLDGAEQEVIEDTVTPANNRPLPVKLTDVTGDINITANDLNVQLGHTGANPDSVQIGDGTETLSITASGEAETSDATAHTKLDTLEASLTAIEAELALKLDETVFTNRVGESSPTPTGNTILGRLKDIDDAHTALLAELQLKADLTETQPVSAASLPLPTGAATEATLASIDGKDFATQTTLAALLTELQAKADLVETQPVSAASLPLPTGAATEATLASLAAEDFATQTTLAALLTELQAKADLAETQPVSAASLPLPTGAATEATLSSIDGKVLSGNILAGIAWDHTALTEAATTDTWVFKTGGAGGSTVATVTITYTDTTKETISTVART